MNIEESALREMIRCAVQDEILRIADEDRARPWWNRLLWPLSPYRAVVYKMRMDRIMFYIRYWHQFGIEPPSADAERQAEERGEVRVYAFPEGED